MKSKILSSNEKFTFNELNKKIVINILSHYPKGWKISAVLPILHLAQKQNDGWLSKSAMEHVAKILEVHPMRIHEVASFYTMFHLSFVGRYIIQICRTASCWLNGSNKLVDLCKKKFNIDLNETTVNGLFTLQEVECLGACINAPVVQINDDYYENLNSSSFEKILDNMIKNYISENDNSLDNQSISNRNINPNK
jgi:NADH-quinone oxidoreductase E subunit